MNLIQKLKLAPKNEFEDNNSSEYFEQVTTFLEEIKEDFLDLFRIKPKD